MGKGLEMLTDSVKNNSKTTDFKVTGISIQYATICKRELWFYLHGVDINRENPHISTGSDVDSRFYNDADTRIIDSMIAPDILEDGRIVEVKPSSTEKSNASENQLLYYLWYLKHFYGIDRTGVLAYPTERKRDSIRLTQEKEERIKKLIEVVYEMYSAEEPPKFNPKEVCNSCAYKDFCQVKQ